LSITTIAIATRETYCGAYPLPTTTTYQRGATPLHDRCPVAIGIHYASTTTGELS